ncbi:lipase 1-like [Chelonus insularis]|uniref:lipase 1-like n=1 Tax=Chelonus insularis TaxID=460826 RepID=UPI001588F1AE|nr:lipase 1-like [Chelonus insularis]
MIKIQISIFIFVFTFCNIQGSFSDFFLKDYWLAENIAKRDGYPIETHAVTTEDGYILTVHRIPGSEGGQPILIQHGLLGNSALWIVSGKAHSLAYILADQGYDVWLGNIRGNTQGMNHINLTTSDSEFWDFSYHEMAVYDLPAMINYIHALTNRYPFYIGHSQGGAMFYILASEVPDVANTVKLSIGLAPVAYKSDMWDPVLRLISNILRKIDDVLSIVFNIQTFMTPFWPLFLLRLLCAVLSIGNYNCLDLFPTLVGAERPELFDQAILPAVAANFPAGTSKKNMRLYAQLMQTDRFERYDYGETKNLEIYNSPIPPEYDLKKVTQPHAIFLADADVFAHLPDLNKLFNLLPNIVDEHLVNASGFSHMDFLWGSKSRDVIYPRILELIDRYNN